MVKKIIYNIETGEEELVDEKIEEEVEVEEVIPKPTLEERLEQTEELLQTVTMAFTEYVFTQGMNDNAQTDYCMYFQTKGGGQLDD